MITTPDIQTLDTVEARKLEYDCPTAPKPKKEEKPAKIFPDPSSNFSEPTATYATALLTVRKSSLGMQVVTLTRARLKPSVEIAWQIQDLCSVSATLAVSSGYR